MKLPILTYPNQILRQKAKKVKDIKSPEIKELVLDMLETMEKNGNALGLAAPQVGKSIRLCVVKLEGKTYILINPKITSKSWKKELGEEGCLSFPEKFIPVKRYGKVKVSALDLEEKKIVISATDLLARAFQHEIDHLNGVLFIDKK
jgi:peptide deformylase